MTFDEYRKHDALALADLIRRGEVSRDEVREAACQAIDTHNPALGAVVRTRFDNARDEAKRLADDAPFSGVPTLTKDLMMGIGGEPLTFGSAAMKAFRCPQDSTLVTRIRAAGLSILGQTATPELGLMGITEPRAFPHPVNPWQPEHSPGGSSGGAAAAVAAGLVPLAMAGDGGGSIRIPASHCGLFGLKPSRGRVPVGPLFNEVWQGAVVEHALTRSVRDSAALLDATNGSDPGAPWPLPRVTGYLAATQRSPPRLRVALSLGKPLGEPVGAYPDPEVVAAVEAAGKTLAALGHRVEWVDPPVDGRVLADSYLTLYLGHLAADLAWISEMTGVAVSRLEIEPATRAVGRMGACLPARDYELAKRDWNQASRNMAAFHDHHDVLVMPTAATPAPRRGALYPSAFEERLMGLLALPGLPALALKAGMLGRFASDALRVMPYTQLANLTGQPAMSLPLHLTPDGLPVGVQVLAANGGEMMLLSLAAEIEAATPWAQAAPDLPDHAAIKASRAAR